MIIQNNSLQHNTSQLKQNRFHYVIEHTETVSRLNLQCCGTAWFLLEGIIPPHPWHCKWTVLWLHWNPSNAAPDWFNLREKIKDKVEEMFILWKKEGRSAQMCTLMNTCPHGYHKIFSKLCICTIDSEYHYSFTIHKQI